VVAKLVYERLQTNFEKHGPEREKDMALRKIRKLSLVAVLTLVVPVATGSAQDNALPAGFETQPLMKTTVTRENEPIIRLELRRLSP
jgi:uncharacterized protein YjbK